MEACGASCDFAAGSKQRKGVGCNGCELDGILAPAKEVEEDFPVLTLATVEGQGHREIRLKTSAPRGVESRLSGGGISFIT